MTHFEELIREESENICDALNCNMAKSEEQVTGELSTSSRDSLVGGQTLKRVINTIQTALLLLIALILYYFFMPRVI